MRDRTGDLQPMPGTFPGYLAPTARIVAGERKPALARQSMPSSRRAIFKAAIEREVLEKKGGTADVPKLRPAFADKRHVNKISRR